MKKVILAVLIFALTSVVFSSCELLGGISGNTPDGTKECAHEWTEATCQEPEICVKCGVKTGEKSDHRYTEATCTAPKTCETCGIWLGLALGHKYSDATCTSPKTCSVCGDTKGDIAHDFAAATCTASKTCKECGLASGDPLGHDLKTIITNATCSADGLERTRCTTCGEVTENKVIPKLDHADLPFTYNNDATAEKDGTVSAFCPSCDYTVTEALVGSSALIKEAFGDKKISILGDSISTYLDISSGVAADTTNSTIRNTIVWNGYKPTNSTFGGTSADSTWWQRTINALGATRLVNNSHSGRSVYQAVNDSCMQLHDDTGENAGETPDIIFIYLGTNDNGRTMGSASGLSMEYIAQLADKANYTPSNLAEAYAVMLYRIQMTYPDAEIYCLTNLERSDMDISLTHSVSKVIRDVAGMFDGVYIADIAAESGVTRDNPDYELYMPKDTGGKSIHPGVLGMERIYYVVQKTVLENSAYLSDAFEDLLPSDK